MIYRKPLLSAALMFALRLLAVEYVKYAATAPPAARAVGSVATPMPALGGGISKYWVPAGSGLGAPLLSLLR